LADDNVTPAAAPAKGSDLPVRAASAAVMLLIAGVALWVGGFLLDLLIVAAAAVCFYELVQLVLKATPNLALRVAAIGAGALYVGVAALSLTAIHGVYVGAIVGLVVCTDTAAYFTGRKFGGPKIAPRISPSKTWSGLAGGMLGAAAWLALFALVYRSLVETGSGAGSPLERLPLAVAALAGAALAVAAQAGDFLESWLKRRAGVKDSSNLIPGHGGLFDRIDGLLPVAILAQFLMALA
jgi:phosphatidate cytidylyltransferase